MYRLALLFLTQLFSLIVHAQDSVKCFYINKIITSQQDSLRLKDCRIIRYSGAQVKIVFIKKDVPIDSIFQEVITFKQWKDSIFLPVNISKVLYDESDSIVVAPTHKFICVKEGTRDILPLFSKGDENKIRNIKLKFISNPASSIVYLIPKFIWETNPLVAAKDESALNEYRISNGITPLWTPVQEYVYIALFKNKEKYISVQCSPSFKNPVDSVYADFIRK